MIDKVLSIAENEKLGSFLNKFKGGYFGILAGISQVIMLIVGTLVFNDTEEVPITFGSHWVSHLGAATEGAQMIFIAFMLMTVLFAIPFILDLVRKMLPGNEKQRWMFLLPLIFALTTIFGGFGLTFFNMGDFPEMHVFFATTFFISVALMVALLSFIMFFNSNIIKWQAWIGLGCGGLFLLFLLTFIPHLLAGEDLVTLVTSLDEKFALTRVMEWIAIIALVVWFIETGAYMIFMW